MLSLQLSGAQKLVLLVTLPVSSLLLYLLLRSNDEEDDEAAPRVTTTRSTVIEIKVPTYAAGAIIGNKGVNIKQIQDESGARVNFKDDYACESGGAANAERTVVIRGTNEQAQQAECMIHKIVAEAPRKIEEKIYVPQKAVGRIIGREGLSIREIQQISKTRILIDRADPRKRSEKRLFTIIGVPEAIFTAKGLIQEKLDEEDSQQARLALSQANRPHRPRQAHNHRNTDKTTDYQQTSQNPGGGDSFPTNRNTSTSHSHHSETNDSVEKPSAGNNMASNTNRNEEQTNHSPWKHGFVDVYVSSVATPENFWVQIVSRESIELDQLNKSIADYCNAQAKNHDAQWKVGDFVGAPYEKDGNWYRARVMDVLENGQVDLYFPDYGDSMYMEGDLLVPLLPEFLKLQPQAQECCFSNIEPKDPREGWSEEAVEFFEDLTHAAQWKVLVAQSLQLVPETGVRMIKLVDTNGSQDVDIAAELVKRGLARWKPVISTTQSASIKQDTIKGVPIAQGAS